MALRCSPRSPRAADSTCGIGWARSMRPTLLLHGAHDSIPLEMVRALGDAIPDARVVVLERSGHFPFIEEPAVVFDTLGDFIREAAEKCHRHRYRRRNCSRSLFRSAAPGEPSVMCSPTAPSIPLSVVSSLPIATGRCCSLFSMRTATRHAHRGRGNLRARWQPAELSPRTSLLAGRAASRAAVGVVAQERDDSR